MNSERDIDAISTWDSRENDPGRLRHPDTSQTFSCACGWTGRGGARAYAHAVIQHHLVRGINNPYTWDGRISRSEKETR